MSAAFKGLTEHFSSLRTMYYVPLLKESDVIQVQPGPVLTLTDVYVLHECCHDAR